MPKNIINLKKATLNDLDQKWVNWLNDKKVNLFSKKKFTKHTLKSQKKYLSKIFRSKTKVLFIIKYDEENIGNILISKISKKNDCCEISYMIGVKTLWNKNIGTKLIKLISKYIFNKLKINNIFAGTRNDNIASQRILIKNKFKLIKTFKNDVKESKTYFNRLIFLKTNNEKKR